MHSSAVSVVWSVAAPVRGRCFAYAFDWQVSNQNGGEKKKKRMIECSHISQVSVSPTHLSQIYNNPPLQKKNTQSHMQI